MKNKNSYSNIFLSLLINFKLISLNFIIIIILIIFSTSCKQAPKSKSPIIGGALDLSSYNFETMGNIQLDGEWDFYKEKFLTEKDLELSDFYYSKNKIMVPGNWNDLFVGK